MQTDDMVSRRGGTLKRSSLIVVATLVAALAVAACGSSSSGGGSSGGGTQTTASASATRAKFQACLKQHGVTLPTPGNRANPGNRPGGSGTTTLPTPSGTTTFPRGGRPGGFRGGFFGGNSKNAQAFKTCAKQFGGGFRPGAGAPGTGAPGAGGPGAPANGGTGSGPSGKARSKTIKQFVACVRIHGYPQMPSASSSASGSLFPKSLEHNKKFLAAAKKCFKVLRQT